MENDSFYSSKVYSWFKIGFNEFTIVTGGISEGDILYENEGKEDK